MLDMYPESNKNKRVFDFITVLSACIKKEQNYELQSKFYEK